MKNLASRTAQTHARLIKAATQVFATAALTGAITREIARVAAVNEVTLFRHFQNKEQLLAIDLKASVDSFTGMLLHGILRFSHISTALEYSRECYVETCVNLFVRGISTLPLQEVGGSVDSSTTK
ncbi:TetR/AcrR family transcriptional regulator [Nostoc sp. XA010]|uniref:TetR/AcrR family transcriptional regulator n=1 Tax=Nostoc sp. XA010 TaxID=2780407 RepID=UPI001E432960|nr:helix-turn-helix domain-containing protein [Nostoc sp. XA010]MCC5658538.1 TetR/AcrR family transcriptional regulator [Nostoc sp. XA010]